MQQTTGDTPAGGPGRPPPASILGAVSVQRVRRLRFPAFELRDEERPLAGMGRYSALNIYFGPGQKIDLPGGVTWRLTALERGAALCPVVANERRQRMAMAAAWIGNYGINGRDYAYTLNPAEARRGRAGRWDLYCGEARVARFTRRPFGALCEQPLPLPALLLGLLLTRFGIPGEGEMHLPELHWG